MKNFFQFTPEDFTIKEKYEGHEHHFEVVVPCRLANEKLNAAIEAAPLVYGYPEKQNVGLWNLSHFSEHTQSARLICIEQLPKVECSHEPSPLESYNGKFINFEESFCKHCGLPLKATWSAK